MTPATQHRVVSRDEWLKARTALLTKEKEFTRLRDQLSAQKRALPWVRIDKEYIFDGPNGKVTLAGLFDGRSQDFITHLMMGPGASAQSVADSFSVGLVDAVLAHHQDLTDTHQVNA